MPESLEISLPVLDPILIDGFNLNIDHYLKHDYTDISEANELPAVIEYLNQFLQRLTEQKLIAKHNIKVVESRVFFALRGGQFTELYADKQTDKSLGMAVQADASVGEAVQQHAILVGWCQRIMNLITTVQVKLDIVRSTEATRRKFITENDDEN